MAQVITFENVRPAARYDGVAWSEARVQEASSPTGSWSTIDTITLDPVDANPENPAFRHLTTALASSTEGLWYRIVFADGAGATAQPTSPVRNALPAPDARDLCTLEDVTSYVPGYTSDPDTDLKLQALITAQSELIMGPAPGGCGREIVGLNATARDFPIDTDAVRTWRLPIGDLSEIDETTVIQLVSNAGAVVATLDNSTVVGLYGIDRAPTRGWEPITSLLFDTSLGAPALTVGYLIRVTGDWGFPEVPDFIREACAARVILRYVNDVATAGTDFAAALDTIDTAALFRSSEDAIDALRIPVIG